MKYRNLPTVCCTLVPCEGGLILIRRGDKTRDGYGQLALPGGFQDGASYETVQRAAARELDEEMGFLPYTTDLKVVNAETDEYGHNVIFFEFVGADLGPWEGVRPLLEFPPNEILEIVHITEPVETAYPLHTAEVKRWFDRQKAGA